MLQISPKLTRTSTLWLYLGTALLAFSMLALQIAFTRLLSVTSWYYLAFFAVSTAMLGMTAGAINVYLRPKWFTEDQVNASITISSLGCSLAIPFSLLMLCLLPLVQTPSIMTFISLLLITLSCSLPYYFSGIAITAILNKLPIPTGKAYASDLIGASFGCLFVLVGLGILDAPSLILLCAAISALAAFCFAQHEGESSWRRPAAWIFSILFVLSIANSFTMYGIRPFIVKGHVEPLNRHFIERWNSFSRVVVHKESKGTPQFWEASPKAPLNESVVQHQLIIDGFAGTTVRRFNSIEDITHLKYDITNLSYFLRPRGGACIIGVGGGRDIQSAILFGHEKVVGIDVNPIFINLLQHEFRKLAGLADRKEVELHIDEARSWLSRDTGKYSIIQMSLIDTWAATGAGAFSLSENGLYTVEAWQVILDRLTDDGIFTVSRWYDSANIGEVGRAISLAVASLLRSGISDPSKHIAMGAVSNLSTLLVSKQPFTQQDIATLKKVARELEYNLVILPDEIPKDPILSKIISAQSEAALHQAVSGQSLNYEPPTDENPYFFNMIKLQHLHRAIHANSGVLCGNLLATVTLCGLIFSLSLTALATIIIPLKISAPLSSQALRPMQFWSGAMYFSMIGAGFMFVEIGLVQRFSIFLGHPVYALGILLFTIILSSGIGSYLSERLPLTRIPWLYLYPLVTAMIISVLPVVLRSVISRMITSPIPLKIATSIGVIFPLGIFMGFFFPTGMRLFKPIASSETPWYWALNGIFSVLASALAVFFSIYISISTNFYIAAVCYASLLACFKGINSGREIRTEKLKTTPSQEEFQEINVNSSEKIF